MTVEGDYACVRTFLPLGRASRDIGQFIEDDSAPYLIFESYGLVYRYLPETKGLTLEENERRFMHP